jgi:hypothetical protein
VWIIARTPQRSWYTLAVVETGERAKDAEDDDAKPIERRYEFSW